MSSSEVASQQALVTGATGFLGRPVCDLLRAKGYHVAATGRRNVSGPWHEFCAGDLTQSGIFEDLCQGRELIVHLAANTHAVATSPADESNYRRLNVELTQHLVAAAVKAKVKAFVFMSSVKVLGEGSEVSLPDDATPKPTSLYGHTKQLAEEIVHNAGREHDLHTCVLRAPLMYGPGVRGNLKNMIAAIGAGRFPPLPETENRRSLIDVRDVARALVLVAESPQARGRTYTVTDERDYSTRQMQDMIRTALGLAPLSWSVPEVAINSLARAGDLLHRLGLPFPLDSVSSEKLLGSSVYASHAIKSELGFEPRYSFDEALPEMVP